MSTLCRISWNGRTFMAPGGMRLSEALPMECGITRPCGGCGHCGQCIVKVTAGFAPPGASDRHRLSPGQIAAGYRLACQLTVSSDLAIESAAVTEMEPGLPADATRGGARTLGLAVDFGTTTITASLLDLRTGKVLGRESRLNPQSAYGWDVMTRLACATSDSKAGRRLRESALAALRSLASSLCGRCGSDIASILAGTLVGNPVMHHLLLGLDVSGLAAAPFQPVRLTGSEEELPGLPPLYFAPLIGGFVGSDAVAGILSTRITNGQGTVLLVDIGTNTEIVLWHRGRLSACSAPSGPAFEGGAISQGMRAEKGAIASVRFEAGDLELDVIGGGPALGLCGSGLLDAVSVLLTAGVIDAGGRIWARGPLAGRVVGCPDNGGHPAPLSVRLAEEVVLTQQDVRMLQLAKGAVRSGIDVLLAEAGADATDLQQIILAGSFGAGLNPGSALRLGLLPSGRVLAAGSTALAGAELMTLSGSARREAERIAAAVRHVALAAWPGYLDFFEGALEFGKRAIGEDECNGCQEFRGD